MVLHNLIHYTVDSEDTLCAPSHPSGPRSGPLRTHPRRVRHICRVKRPRLRARTHPHELSSESVTLPDAFAQRGVEVRFTSCIFFFFWERKKKKHRCAMGHCVALRNTQWDPDLFAAEGPPEMFPLKAPSPLSPSCPPCFLPSHPFMPFSTPTITSLCISIPSTCVYPWYNHPFLLLSLLVRVLYTLFFRADAVYVCIHGMPVSVSIVWPTYLCSIHYLLLTL